MNKQKGLAPILIVLLIALGIGGFLIYQKQKPTVVPQQVTQSTPTSTSNPESSASAETADPDSIGTNWRTYQNKEYSVQYPSTYTVSELSSSDIVLTPLRYNPDDPGELGRIVVEKLEEEIDSSIKTEDFIKNTLFANNFRGAIFKYLNIEKLGDVEVYRVSTIAHPENKSAQSFVRVKNILYYFIFQTGADPNIVPSRISNYLDYERVISTFKPNL